MQSKIIKGFPHLNIVMSDVYLM